MTVYLDASVLVANLLDESSSMVVEQFLQSLDNVPIVSDFAAGEIAAAIARRWRIGDLDQAFVETILARLDAWRDDECRSVETEPSDIRHAAEIVRRLDLALRMPDAIHTATCLRLGLTLATFDTRLARAATTLGIDVIVPA